jgi:hypothetical protein
MRVTIIYGMDTTLLYHREQRISSISMEGSSVVEMRCIAPMQSCGGCSMEFDLANRVVMSISYNSLKKDPHNRPHRPVLSDHHRSLRSPSTVAAIVSETISKSV